MWCVINNVWSTCWPYQRICKHISPDDMRSPFIFKSFQFFFNNCSKTNLEHSKWTLLVSNWLVSIKSLKRFIQHPEQDRLRWHQNDSMRWFAIDLPYWKQSAVTFKFLLLKNLWMPATMTFSVSWSSTIFCGIPLFCFIKSKKNFPITRGLLWHNFKQSTFILKPSTHA